MSVKPTASLASKLSRIRKAESSKPAAKDELNESADDFVKEPTKKVEKKKTEKVLTKKPTPTPTPTPTPVDVSAFLVQTNDAFLKCPFCGKSFSAGQELKR